MFEKGERAVSFIGPVNPAMSNCPPDLIPASAYWIRGQVEKDDGVNLTLSHIERNSHVSGLGFGPSSTKWYPSPSEEQVTFSTLRFQSDPELRISSVNQVVL